jgi:transposase
MIRGGFLGEEDRRALIALARDGSSLGRVTRRANALVLLDDGLSCQEVARVLLFDDDTIRGWYDLFEQGGLESLTRFDMGGSASKMSAEQAEALKVWITASLPRSTRPVGAWIEKEFGLVYESNLDVAGRNLTAMRGDRGVIAQQAIEGAVLAPGAGRALSVPVSAGQVVLPGETIATFAEGQFILRLQLPERHAQFMRAGDSVRIGARGMQADAGENMREGKVRLVYPEIQGGRVIADVEVAGLGDYFVGERTRVYVDTGTRRTIVVPAAYVYRRAGVNYVRLAGGDEVVVQPGEVRDIGETPGIEILAGLKDGDTLATP